MTENEKLKILQSLAGEYRKQGWDVSITNKLDASKSGLPDFILTSEEANIAGFIESSKDISEARTVENWQRASASGEYEILVVTSTREAASQAAKNAFNKGFFVKTRSLKTKIRKKGLFSPTKKKTYNYKEWLLAFAIILFTVISIYFLIPFLAEYSRLNIDFYAPHGLERQIHEERLFRRQQNPGIPSPNLNFPSNTLH